MHQLYLRTALTAEPVIAGQQVYIWIIGLDYLWNEMNISG